MVEPGEKEEESFAANRKESKFRKQKVIKKN
jgi:hypothetical protein